MRPPAMPSGFSTPGPGRASRLPSKLDDGWYEAEERTGAGMVRELQRIHRRSRVRTLLVIGLALVMTAGVMARVIMRERLVSAQVVLALTEGSLSTGRSGLPADQLGAYVRAVLLADRNLLEVIERRDLYPLRGRLGPQFAIAELWDQTRIEISRNAFIYYGAEDATARKSARIAIIVRDSDPERAFGIARDLATVAIRAHHAERLRLTGQLARHAGRIHAGMTDRARALASTTALVQTGIARAKEAGRLGHAAALLVDLAALDSETTQVEAALSLIARSREVVADQIAAAGLDLTLAIVDERRPEPPENLAAVLAMIGTVVGFGALLAATMIVGVFDPRVHDVDDVTRLGLPVLGQLPAFAGDDIGSLSARGLALPRKALVKRWLSLR